MNETVSQFLIGTAQNAIGAFVGFLLAIYLEAHKDRLSKKNQIKLVVASIKEELSDISRSLQHYVDLKEPLYAKIQTPSWDALLGSGIILQLIEKPIYACAIKTYSLIRSFNEDIAQRSNEDKLVKMKSIINSALEIDNYQ